MFKSNHIFKEESYYQPLTEDRFGKLPWEVMQATDLSIGSKAVYALINMYATNDLRECWHGNRKFAHNINLSMRQVARYLQELDDRGYIRREMRWHEDKEFEITKEIRYITILK